MSGAPREPIRHHRSLEPQQTGPGGPADQGRSTMNRSISRAGAAVGAALLVIALSAAPALACGGLIGPNGAVNLLRTTTFAGVPRRRGALRHGVPVRRRRRGVRVADAAARASRRASRRAATGRSSASSARPSRVPRLARGRRGAAAAGSAEELMKVRIDALDITVLRGGAARGRRVGDGARLPPPARRARGPRLLRRPQPDLPGRRVRRRCGRRARPGGRRRHAGPRHHPDRQPVGPAAHPRPRQDRRRSASRPTSTC